MPRCGADGTIGADELSLAAWKQHRLGPNSVVMEPSSRRVCANDGYTVSMIKKLYEPRHMTISATEWRVNEYSSVPSLREAVIAPCELLICWNPMVSTR